MEDGVGGAGGQLARAEGEAQLPVAVEDVDGGDVGVVGDEPG